MVEANVEVKNILVSQPGNGDKRDYSRVPIQPGTRSVDILADLGLEGMVLVSPDGRTFSPIENVYEKVREGDKVYAEPASIEAGVRCAQGAV